MSLVRCSTRGCRFPISFASDALSADFSTAAPVSFGPSPTTSGEPSDGFAFASSRCDGERSCSRQCSSTSHFPSRSPGSAANGTS